MLLPDHEIMDLMATGSLTIDPFEDWMLQPASVDVQLGDELRWYRVSSPRTATIPVDPYDPDPDDLVHYPLDDDEQFPLLPARFCLATTLQSVVLGPQVAARLEGKSSLGRQGLIIHSTAGFIDPGFRGQITLEIININNRPLILTPGMPVAQLSFTWLRSPARRPYGHEDLRSHYQDQAGVTSARALERA